jgi:rRNA maturation endonuclease Nob1
MNCPKCKSHNTDNWKPGKICPECGGELEDLGVSCCED